MSHEIERRQPKRPLDETDDWWIQGGVVSALGTVGMGGLAVLFQFLPFLGIFSTVAFGGAGLALMSTLFFVLAGTASHKRKSKELE